MLRLGSCNQSFGEELNSVAPPIQCETAGRNLDRLRLPQVWTGEGSRSWPPALGCGLCGRETGGRGPSDIIRTAS